VEPQQSGKCHCLSGNRTIFYIFTQEWELLYLRVEQLFPGVQPPFPGSRTIFIVERYYSEQLDFYRGTLLRNLLSASRPQVWNNVMASATAVMKNRCHFYPGVRLIRGSVSFYEEAGDIFICQKPEAPSAEWKNYFMLAGNIILIYISKRSNLLLVALHSQARVGSRML
jgi:hypothetical protein